MKITKIARIVECMDLPAAVFEPVIRTGNAVQKYGQVSWRSAGTYNLFPSAYANAHLDEL
jgi:hypothetical protein